jgi:hypothetical protein
VADGETHGRRMRRSLAVIILLSLVPGVVRAQRNNRARVVSAPSEPSLLNLTSSWARASALGELLEERLDRDDIELRVWHGFGPAETQATILRRIGGHWSASFARVIRCELRIPAGVGDTASATTMRRFVAEARRNCGASVVDVAPGSRLITADTLIVQPLDASETDIAAAWAEAERAGVANLPGRVPHTRAADDGVTFVVEVRHGNEYRAAEIADVDPPEMKEDSQMRQIYAAVTRLRP